MIARRMRSVPSRRSLPARENSRASWERRRAYAWSPIAVAHEAAPGEEDRTRGQHTAVTAMAWIGFPCDQRLVEVEPGTSEDGGVDGYLLAPSEEHHLIQHDVGRSDGLPAVVASDPHR